MTLREHVLRVIRLATSGELAHLDDRQAWRNRAEEHADAILALLPALPPGWVAMPEEPTEEIIEAMNAGYRSARRHGVSGMSIEAQWLAEYGPEIAAYRAMLAARPALSDGPNHIGDANEMVPALSTESGPRRPLLSVFPDVQGGALCIHETRIPWEAVISFHDDGSSPAEIVREYPGLTEQQVRDVIAWRYPTPPTETAMSDQIERGLADCGEGIPYAENGPAGNAALAAYAVLRCCDLIRAGDWRVPNRIARVAAEMNGETR